MHRDDKRHLLLQRTLTSVEPNSNNTCYMHDLCSILLRYLNDCLRTQMSQRMGGSMNTLCYVSSVPSDCQPLFYVQFLSIL